MDTRHLAAALRLPSARRRLARFAGCLLALACGLSAASLRAQNYLIVNGTYTLPGDASYDSAFIGGDLEGSTTPGTFNQSAYTLTLSQFFYIGNGAVGTYNLSGTGRVNGGTIYVGRGGTGTLNINDAAQMNPGGDMFLGINGDTGTVNQSGTSVVNLGTHGLYIGEYGSTGTYNLNGGTLNLGFINGNVNNPSYNRAVNLNGGTLRATGNNANFISGLTALNVRGNGTTAGSGAVIDTNGFGVTVAQALQHSAISGDAATDGGLLKLGAGTLTLSGTNTYTGGTTFAGGTLNVGSVGALGTSGTLRFTGGTLQYSTANTSDYSARFSGSASQAYSVDTNGQNVTYATGLTSSGGSLTKLGAGMLTLTGSNTYTGATTINAGTLAIAGSSTLGGGSYAGGISDAGSFVYNSSAAQTLSGVISGAGSLTQAGPSTLTLTGANTYTGGTTFAGGILNLGSLGALGTTGTLSFTGGTLQYSPANTTDYSVRFSGAANQAYNIDTNGQNVTFASGLISSGGSLTKLGPGTLTLTGANTYSGGTNVNAGTLLVGGNGSLANTPITVNVGGTLSVSDTASVSTGGNSLSVNGTAELSGGRITTANALVGATGAFTQTGGVFNANSSLFVNNVYYLSGGTLNASAEFVGYSGVNPGNLMASGRINQSGGTNITGGIYIGGYSAYTLYAGTLATPQVSFDTRGLGLFSFNGGTLRASANQSEFFAGSGMVNVRNGGGSIDTNGFDITVSQALQHSNISGDNATDGGLTKLGAGTLTLSGNNTYTGPTNVQGGSLTFNGGVVQGHSALNVNNNGRSLVVFEGNGLSAFSTVTVSSSSYFSVRDSYTILADSMTLNGDGDLRGNATIFTQNFTLAGYSPFEQQGGTLQVRNNLVLNSRGYTLSGGTLRADFGALAAVGSYGDGSFTQYGGQSVFSLVLEVGDHGGGQVIMGGGSMTTPFLDLGTSGTGSFALNGGTLLAGGGINLGNDAGGEGIFYLQGGVLTAGQIVGGPGTSTFNFNGGTLRPYASQDGFVQGLTTANVSNGGAVIDTNGFNVTVPQVLRHSAVSGDNATDGGLTKLGAGTLALSGANTYNGATTVSTGTLLANNTAGSATGTGAVTVGSGGTLGGNGTLAGAVTVQSGGTLAPGALAISRLTLGSTLTIQNNALLAITLGGTTAGSTYDQVRVNGTLTLAGSLQVRTVNGFTLTPGMTFTILDNTSTTALTAGVFTNVLGTLYTDAAGDTFQINYAAIADGDLVPNDVTLTYVGTSVVPEPSSWALFALGAGGLLLAMRRRSRQMAA